MLQLLVKHFHFVCVWVVACVCYNFLKISAREYAFDLRPCQLYYQQPSVPLIKNKIKSYARLKWFSPIIILMLRKFKYSCFIIMNTKWFRQLTCLGSQVSSLSNTTELLDDVRAGRASLFSSLVGIGHWEQLCQMCDWPVCQYIAINSVAQTCIIKSWSFISAVKTNTETLFRKIFMK